MSGDPYEVLGVKPGASAEQLHDAYRRMVKLHHPDRNGGSAESTRRFQQIQEAYDRVREMRAHTQQARPSRPSARRPADDPSVEARMRDLERDLREAQAAQERARRAARDAVRDASGDSKRPSDEELGYYTTDDSFGKILADVREEVSQKLSEARHHPAVKRVADIVEGLEGLTSRFDKR